MQRLRLVLPLCVTALVAVPLTASAADEVGDAGVIDEIQVNGDKADGHATQHGSLKIRFAKKQWQEYVWGGAKCSTFTLSDEEVELLVGAFHTRPRTRVVPFYKNGTNGARCLVAFKFRSPGNNEPDVDE